MKTRKFLDKFYDYTVNDNSAFKVALGDVIVSISVRNALEANSKMMEDENGLIGKNMSFLDDPNSHSYFTFESDNMELKIFNQYTWEDFTEKYCGDMPGYNDFYKVVYDVTPFELVDILVRVRNDVKEKEENGK